MDKHFLSKKTIIDAKNGNKKALEKVIDANMNFIYKVIQKCGGSYTESEDLISEGIVGILKALKNYNTEKEVKFLTYASPYIKHEILEYKNKNKFLIKLSDSKHREYLKLKKTEKDSNSKALNQFELFKTENFISLECSSNHIYPNSQSDFDQMNNRLYLETLFSESNLSDIELFILKKKYLSLYSVKEICSYLKLSAEEVRKIEKQAIAKVKSKAMV